MHRAVPPLLHMHSSNRTRTALAYSMQVACGGTPSHLSCIREDAHSNLGLENRQPDECIVAWLRFLGQQLEYYLERCYECILPRNFNECLGGMISLVLQTGCPDISFMFLLVLLSCCQHFSDLSHILKRPFQSISFPIHHAHSSCTSVGDVQLCGATRCTVK
jgi:hypothetical protein